MSTTEESGVSARIRPSADRQLNGAPNRARALTHLTRPAPS
jgi:hypothetical protein